ncbi:hypothetical protein HDU92_002245 [Lobulomyces angularis]|nr:hypothetical protein HDU92_002245 [Lobulomyces angularis]
MLKRMTSQEFQKVLKNKPELKLLVAKKAQSIPELKTAFNNYNQYLKKFRTEKKFVNVDIRNDPQHRKLKIELDSLFLKYGFFDSRITVGSRPDVEVVDFHNKQWNDQIKNATSNRKIHKKQISGPSWLENKIRWIFSFIAKKDNK